MVTGFLERFIRQTVVLSAFVSILFVASNVQAGHGGGLHIDAASWNGTTLTANGGADKPRRGGGSVGIFDADSSAPLGTASISNSGNWTYSGTTCADNIYASQDDVQTAPFAVSGPGCGGVNTPPFANDDAYNAIKNTVLNISAPGVLGNDTDAENDPLTAIIDVDATFGSVTLNANGSFEYTPDSNFVGDDSFSYFAHDGTEPSATSALVTISVLDTPEPPVLLPQTDFKIMMNYELGMHCTGFEFAYCCVLPAYNSILSQIVKPGSSGTFPELLEGDPVEGLDALGRETVLRDRELDENGNFKKYVLRYWHDAQPRNDGRGKAQTSTLISGVEGNSLLAWNTVFDSAALNADGTFVTGSYNGADGVVLGNGTLGEGADNYQNAVWNHLYFYENLEGDNSTGTTADSNKIRLGVNGHVVYPTDCGAALHPMGPTSGGAANDCGGFSNGNVLTFSGDKGTVVFTQMKVLENLPIMLTSPRIWEALGLPLTPFEDSIDFFGDPGLVDEDSVRPYVAMKAQLYEYDGAGNNVAVIGSTGDPVIGFGTAPIDIPNCERCHSNGPSAVNTPNSDPTQWAMVQDEYNFWNAYYNIDTGAGDSDWYSRLKSAAISMLNGHDLEHGTSFAANYPSTGEGLPQNTRLGHESIICQRCHADNVIAAVKSASFDHDNDASTPNKVIPPVTEAVHNNHRSISSGGDIAFSDAEGRDGGCQGCHPAHRSDGNMAGYPITLDGENFYASGDNRDANGGCFVGRDVHSNPGKDTDGAETPEHLNAVGQWLSDNVYSDQGASGDKGIWCTNCHNQLGQEIWKAENMEDLVHNVGINNPRAQPTLAAVASAVGTTEAQAIAWLDPKADNPLGDFTHAIWDADPGLCQFLVDPNNPAHDGKVATVEVAIPSAGHVCSTGTFLGPVDCSADGGPVFNICGSFDVDGDFSVNAMDFCTTPDCVAAAQAKLSNSAAVAVPFSAATDGRDHWLSAGEPHCADCHAAPYVEQSGNIDAFPPFNYPRKASLMRYSRGHQDITCQGCHESIHGLYPVTPTIDTTTYAQAAALNADGSHGPLKCGTCHEVDGEGIPSWMSGVEYNGRRIRTFDDAVSWAHTFTAQVSPLEDGGVCQNCHQDRTDKIADNSGKWLRHAHEDRIGRKIQDKAEIAALGHVAGGNFVDADNAQGLFDTVCTACHGLQGGPGAGFEQLATCDNTEWKLHNIDGRLSEKVWEYVSDFRNGSTCGW